MSFSAAVSALSAAEKATTDLATFEARADVKDMMDHRLSSADPLTPAQMQLAATQIIFQTAATSTSSAYAAYSQGAAAATAPPTSATAFAPATVSCTLLKRRAEQSRVQAALKKLGPSVSDDYPKVPSQDSAFKRPGKADPDAGMVHRNVINVDHSKLYHNVVELAARVTADPGAGGLSAQSLQDVGHLSLIGASGVGATIEEGLFLEVGWTRGFGVADVFGVENTFDPDTLKHVEHAQKLVKERLPPKPSPTPTPPPLWR